MTLGRHVTRTLVVVVAVARRYVAAAVMAMEAARWVGVTGCVIRVALVVAPEVAAASCVATIHGVPV
jgi:hypothetical protein